MPLVSYYAGVAAFTIVIMCWFVFAGTFFLRKKTETAPEKTRAPKSFLGIALQGVAFGLVWAVRRTPLFSPFLDDLYALNLVFQIAAIGLAAVSVWMAVSAIGELGKQWSFQARLIEGHKLVTSGVYQIVRHPIYTAMFGMLLATSFIISHWIAAIAGAFIFLIGTRIRTVSEEKLLNDAFGAEFEKWKAKVPGLIPFV